MPAATRRRALVVLAGLSVGAVSCAADAGDDVTFATAWGELRGLLPAESTLQPDDPLCAEALGALREARAELPAAPDPLLDEAVNRWLGLAESTMFECPPQTAEVDGFAEAYARLEEAAAAVDAELGIREDGA